MARTEEGERLTEEHRLQQVHLADRLAEELRRLFRRTVRWDDIDGSSEEFARRAGPLVAKFREASRLLSVDYMHAFHAVESPGAPVPIEEPADVDDASLARRILSTVRGVLKALSRKGHGESVALDRAEVSVTLKGVKLAGDGGRQVIETEVRRGNGPVGYARVVDADPCPFCAMLASRGLYFAGEESPGALLYRSDSFGDVNARFVGDGRFKVHDGCCCTMEPVYMRGGKIDLPGNGNALAKEWAEVAAGQDDPWLTWQRWRESGTLPENYDGPLDGKRRAAPSHGQSTGRRQRPTPEKASEREERRERERAEKRSRDAGDKAVEKSGKKVDRRGNWDRQKYLDYAAELSVRADGVAAEIAELKARGQTDQDISVMALAQEHRALLSRIDRYRKQAEKM
ncbi:hypothetical protein [Corynebacterium sp.]|uniref:VG15 protein n=1 Tax=Corynebacterium sp. TaxID=1720 RepID=UPI003B3BAE36